MSEIKTFDDVSRHHQIDKETLDGIKNRLARSMGMNAEEFGFTGLQKTAFNTEGFWLSDNDYRHIIIQGATSSGKTLVSEMAILDTLKNDNKCIVLVPLRAMVRERWNQLRSDFGAQEGDRRIYASSADYQDHDGEIMGGNYSVAIIVYEKFFTMLSQSSDKMLHDCELLVVDELQMLSNANRGPKLEIAIQKVLRRNKLGNVGDDTQTRVMCLTTSDCRVENIKRWLTVDGREPILIEYEKRPVTLTEHVIRLDGKYKCRTTAGEESAGTDEIVDGEGQLPMPESNINSRRIEVGKRNLLKQLLQNIYAKNPMAKVLIFVNGRRKTQTIAEFVAGENILPSTKLTGELTEIDNYEADDYQRVFKTKLFPKRIACHNAAMSTALREFIEKLFSNKNESSNLDNEVDPLKLVVATETLTIGMNMPVDVMILFDHEIRRTDRTQDLTSQEYKNFVGRAGRLGQKNMDGGESYIFATDGDEVRKFWNKYVNCRREEIKSALMGVSEEHQAPYYLSLMDIRGKESYSIEDFKALRMESFSESCGGKPINMKNICEDFVKTKLCTESDDDFDNEKLYSLTGFGKGMTPYAFSLSTCKKINRFFFQGGLLNNTLKPGKGGLPETITREDFDNNRYLLDMLYILCSTYEIMNMGQLKLPLADNVEKSRKAMDQVEKLLKNIISTKDGGYEPWGESPLPYMCASNYDWNHEHRDKENFLRAVLLWYWTQGKRIEDIKKLVNVPQVDLIVGDLARLAETVSYQLDSIHHCYGHYRGRLEIDNSALLAIRKLSLRVNYGVPQDLVKIANRHVYGLDRKTILAIGELFHKEFADKYNNPLHMLLSADKEDLPRIQEIISDEYRNEIIQSTDESNTRDNFGELINAIKNEPPANFGDEECQALEKFHDASADDKEYCLDTLKKIFSDNVEQSQTNFFKNMVLRFPIRDRNFATLTFGKKNIALIVRTDNFEKMEDYFYHLNQLKETKSVTVLLSFGNEESTSLTIGVGNKIMLTVGDKTFTFDLAMTISRFAGLVAQAVKNDMDASSTLAEMLCDTCGLFDRVLNGYNHLLQNYSYEAKSSDAHAVRVLWDKKNVRANDELEKALKQYNIPYRILQWGTPLYAERPKDEPTIIFVKWDAVQKSRSLYNFYSGLFREEYRHTYAIFATEDDFNNWGGDSHPHNVLEHCTSTKNFSEDIAQFKLLLEHWQSEKFLVGISYAHEDEMGAERPDVTLLKKFVEQIKADLPSQIIFFDSEPRSEREFQGNGALKATLEKYSQCRYFVVLDDEFYDKSEICHRWEGSIIRQTLCNMGNPAGHLWFLHVKGEKHSSLFNRNNDYCTDINENNIDHVAEMFVAKVRESLSSKTN